MADIQSDKAHAAARDTAGTRLSAKRAAKAAKKAAQRGTSNPVEEVAKSVREVNAWIDVHGRKIWFALGAVVLVCVGWFAVSSYQDKRDREAGELLRAAIATSHGIIVSVDEPAPEEPLYPTFNSVQERDNKALQQFRALQKKFPNSQAARYSMLGEANGLLELGKFSEAAAAYARALDAPHASADTFLRVRALEGSGYALEGQKQYAQARKRFEELSRLQNGAYRTLGDYHRARMLVAEGQRAEARKVLEALSKAAADKPEELGEQGERFESVALAAQNLLSELGGQPADKAGGKNSGISQSVLDALRKQLATQKK